MKRWSKSPALHFLAIGGLLFATRGASDSLATRPVPAGGEWAEIVVDASVLEAQRAVFVSRTGRAPEPAEEEALLQALADEEILYREALVGGLDRNDDVVRNRLVELAGFVSDDPEKDEDALHREARILGLDRSDLIVRRHLVRMMKLLLRRPAALEPVSDADLETLLDRERERFALPPEVTLTQIYLSATRRGDATEGDAQALLAALRDGEVPPEAASGRGDPFPLGNRFTEASTPELQKTFGARFVADLEVTPEGEWAGPIASSYGQHLVWIHERRPARKPPLESVRKRLWLRLREVRGEERLRLALERLRSRYVVRIEEPSPAASIVAARANVPSDLPGPEPFPGD